MAQLGSAWLGLPQDTSGYHRLPQVTTGYHKCQIGLVWLSSYFESILALDLKNRFFVQIRFEFYIISWKKSGTPPFEVKTTASIFTKFSHFWGNWGSCFGLKWWCPRLFSTDYKNLFKKWFLNTLTRWFC